MRTFWLVATLWVLIVSPACAGNADDALLAAAVAGDVQAARAALAHGSNPETRNPSGLTPLILAAKNGHVEIARILLDVGASPLTKSEKGSMPLGFAAEQGSVEMIKLLIEHGTPVDVMGNTGVTPLVSAALRGHLGAVKFLIDQNADIEKSENKDDLGHTITPLWAAAISGHAEIVNLLLDHGARINRTTKGDTVLMEAAKHPNPDILRLLIKRGANVHHWNGNSNRTALLYAAYNGQEENVKVLLEAGARPTKAVLEEGNFRPESPVRRLVSDTLAKKLATPAPRTFRDVADIPPLEPSADDKE